MQDPVLTVSITTPQSWAQQNAIKRRRIPRSPRRNVISLKHLDPKVKKAKEEFLSKAIASQLQIKRSPTNGLQLDPFQTLPIPSTGCVGSMAQYYVQVWAPQHGTAFSFDGHSNPYVSLLWPFALTSDIYFEGLIALCRATYLATSGQSARGDRHFVWHRGNVMTKLRTRLQNPQQCSDDTTILVVATLGTVDYILGDHTGAYAHVSGMRQMIKLRDSTPDKSTRFSGQILQNAEFPVYMAHPFKPEVCEMLSKLPQGFCDIGLTGVLSLQMIRLLSHFATVKAKLSDTIRIEEFGVTGRRKIQTTLEDLHRLATLQTTPTERFLSHGLVAYCYLLRVIHFQDHLTGFYETALKALADIALHQTPSHKSPERKCYLWTNMMIGTVIQHGQIRPRGWTSVMGQFLDNYGEARQWKKLEKELKMFFFEDAIRLLAKEAYDEAVRRKERGESEERDSRVATMAIRNVIL
ncbi:Fungal specific transcription factor domain-containing protein [Cladophialophora immunda]|nr:Fungal specific transcription factor domain-containing protein [Cladophialophora immunda]